MAPLSAPVVIVGAGPAGIRAAERLVAAGLRPVLIDEAERGGGQIYRRQPASFTRPPQTLYGSEAAKAVALHATCDALAARIDHRARTLAFAVRKNEVLTLRDGMVRAQQFSALILATGATDRIMPMPGWTKPGVFSLGASQIALKAQACAIGEAPVFVGTGPLLYLVAWQYAKAGVAARAVLDTSAFARRIRALPELLARPSVLARGALYLADLRRRGIPVRFGITPQAIEGTGRASSIRFLDRKGTARTIDCDAVALGFGLRSETQLADLAGCRFAFDTTAQHYLPALDQDGRSSVRGVYVAGDGAAIRGADAAELAGRLAACAALSDQGHAVAPAEMPQLRAALAPMQRFRQGLERGFPWPAWLAASLPDETIVCRCEAVTAGDIRRAAGPLDAGEINRAKAFSRVGMGRCQGRMCQLAGAELLAAARGVKVDQVGRLRGQAPVKPLPANAELVG
jgi:NADPH-dependent 2,4-dienoyl-CoA reductase/sulfur reductase-like enzyme